MKRALLLLFLSPALLAQNAANSPAETPERHEFIIANFHTEGGATLPQAHIVYGTYGHLNAAKDNAVLLPSHYMANLRGYDWLIGQDRALDTSKLFW
jgi:homoserine O-acetyltransferase